ncbi:MAG: RNA polymerase subunit sigma-24, partial [Chloroflexi bacterium]|nr:RNA polymerase subunit sigma-24 [Chloroflexota bacterium]
MDEFNAIQQLKRNNLKGLEWLVDRYHVQAVQTAFLITGDAELAEDVTQEVFLNLFDTIMSFDERL